MNEPESIVRRVDGSMAISGMPLSEEDKENIRDALMNKRSVEEIVAELIKKHSVVDSEGLVLIK